ncbi:MAG TPA: metal-dependent transcriptional regulator [Tepidisphaeraceae bacterium]|jgi:DtxR family Mn-dependent transcriptional regulator
MATRTVEDYLKAIFSEQQRNQGAMVPMGALAAAMRVAPGTATAMVKTLAESGLVEYEPRGGVKLTGKGEKLALHVVRRHRLVELFLVETLKLDWSEVDEEAEELEHAISEKVLAKIDELLDFPEVDPHGDPIPSSAGKLTKRRLASLMDCPINHKLRVARVLDQDARFLQFVDKASLKPGAELTVKTRDPSADAVSVTPKNRPTLTLGSASAAKILVEEI